MTVPTMGFRSTRVASDAWRPIGIADLEPAAWQAVRELDRHQLVVAGPGSGKTELLAQRAAYLLQTGSIRGERRILALAFKRDAASTLAERVRRRCHPDLADRFSSFTLAAFAKTLVDRFGLALPPERRPPTDYVPVSSADKLLLEDFQRGVRAAALDAAGTNRDAATARRWMGQEAFLKRLGQGFECWSPYSAETDRTDDEWRAAAWAAPHAWAAALEAGRISWDMLMRLAICIASETPAVARALRHTYAHVFLDEVQDVTRLQLELLRTCFPPATARLTAVGDDRQRIMVWAGAEPKVFGWLRRRYEVAQRDLVMNHRAGGRLLSIQHTLMRALDGTAPAPVAAREDRADEGRCAVWTFPSCDAEARTLAGFVAELVADGVEPHEVCILTRMRVHLFAPPLIRELSALGIAARNEEEFQEVQREPVPQLCRALASVAIRSRAPEDFARVCELVEQAARGSARRRDASSRVQAAASALAMRLDSASSDEVAVELVLEEAMTNLFGSLASAAAHVRPRQSLGDARRSLQSAAKLLARCRAESADWNGAIDRFDGHRVVPIMTVHKSKGLEYDTVIFVGLEDDAWWSFHKQPDEERRTFFVAFSRAKCRALFTFSDVRERDGGLKGQNRSKIDSLYTLLQNAGVATVTSPGPEDRARMRS